jgi:AraC-like DNA-binding protein
MFCNIGFLRSRSKKAHMPEFRHPSACLDASSFAPRHKHGSAYVAIITRGRYREAGDQGVFDVSAGDVLFHANYESHANWIASTGAQVINIDLDPQICLPPAFRVAEPQLLIKTALSSQRDVLSLLDPSERIDSLELDWEDQLAADLRQDINLKLGAWAQGNRLSLETISRGFRRHFGTSAVAYRAALQAQRAWREVVTTSTPLAMIALNCGYADQSHLTRAIVKLTGSPPGQWRAKSKSPKVK